MNLIPDYLCKTTIPLTMKSFFFSICFSFAALLTNAQATIIPYTGLLIANGTAGPVGDDNVLDATIPFTFKFYGTGYTTARISTNGFLWLSNNGNTGCCNGFFIPSDPEITNPFIALTQTDWLPTAPANGTIFYSVTGTTPNRVFVVHYENILHISSADRMTGEIQLYETTNEIRLVMSSLTGVANGYTATMGIAAGNGVLGYAVEDRNQSDPYSITNEAWSLSTEFTTLPVRLTSYEAKKVAGTAVLEWSTTFEENNDFFAIERSANGLEFQQIAKINSKGNTSSGHQYSFTDASPLNRNNYYRLVQYDLDKKSLYYGVKMVNFELPSKIIIMPNPIADNFSISIQSIQSTDLQVTVFDMHGRIVTTISKNLRTGLQVIPVISNNWPAGFYTLKIEQNGNITTHKLIKK